MATPIRIVPAASAATTPPLAPLASLASLPASPSAISSSALVEDVALLLAFASFVVAVSTEESHLVIIFNVDRSMKILIDVAVVDTDISFYNLLLRLRSKTIAINCGYNRNEGEETNDNANRTTCDHF